MGNVQLLYIININIIDLITLGLSLWSFMFVFFAFSLGDLQFPSHPKDMQVRWTGNSELSRGVKVSVDVFVCLDVSSVTD